MIYLEGAEDTENRLASLFAIHLVSQILDEAYIIASEAKVSGQPWEYITMLKSFQAASLAEIDEDDIYAVSKDDIHESNIEQYTDVVVTSTPQKVPDGKKKPKSEGNFIGQGDEDLGLPESDHSQVSSKLINNMFDMSEVARVDAPDQTPHDQSPSRDIAKIMDSYVNEACNIVTSKKTSDYVEPLESTADVKKEDYNDYSFLVDVIGSALDNNVAFYLDDALASNEINQEDLPEALVDEDDDDNKSAPPNDDQLHLNLPTMNDAALSNIDAYLTLNRDYEQCSDDDGDPILQDPKGLSMHEITLLTANTSLQDLSSRPDLGQEPKELLDAATSGVFDSITGLVVKKTLARRCRLQGARILACLRGWWRRRTPGKRNELQNPCPHRSACPRSPAARRRSATLTTSIVDSGQSPQLPRDAWKFNTISEALLHVSQWKDYVYTPVGKTETQDMD